MNTQWKNQAALVTGGGRGIGRAAAMRLGALGAAVGVNYAVRADTAEAVAAEIRGAGGRAIAVLADVGDANAVAAMVERVERELGPVSILVNNAGIDGGNGSLDTFEPDEFARLRQVNVNGVINSVRAVMDGMRARRYGRIVNVSSLAGIGTALRGTTWYAATKAAVNVPDEAFRAGTREGWNYLQLRGTWRGANRYDRRKLDAGRMAGGGRARLRHFDDGAGGRAGGHRQCDRVFRGAGVKDG